MTHQVPIFSSANKLHYFSKGSKSDFLLAYYCDSISCLWNVPVIYDAIKNVRLYRDPQDYWLS